MDIKKQLKYWVNSAEDDLSTAELLIQNMKLIHGLFFCHLTIEKALKAHVTRCSGQIPPKVHKLSYLLSLTDLELTEDEKDFCAILMSYQLEGRYPDFYPSFPSHEKAKVYLEETKRLFQWLKMKL